MHEIRLWAPTIPTEITVGADLAEVFSTILSAIEPGIHDGDVLVIASKVVAKAQGLLRSDSSLDAEIDAHSQRLVALRRTEHGVTKIVQATAGPVVAGAGIASSNVDAGMVSPLPEDADRSARVLRRRFRELTGASVGVVISDTAGRPWRKGVLDYALGVAGVPALTDMRGVADDHDQELPVTVRATADAIASAADLVKGIVGRRPVAVVRGLNIDAGAVVAENGRALNRTGATNWFAYGHVEAGWVALGLNVDDVTELAPSIMIEDDGTRLSRAIHVALRDPVRDFSDLALDVTPPQDGQPATVQILGGDGFTQGLVAGRLEAAARIEEVAVRVVVG